MSCGHFNFTVRDRWIFCSNCDAGIDANNPKGERMLDRKRGINRLDAQQQAALRSLQESYRELVAAAGTEDRERLADYANRSER